MSKFKRFMYLIAISNGEKITFNTAPSDTWQAGERKK